MRRKKKWLLLGLMLTTLAVGVISTCLLWPLDLEPSEAAVLGRWATPSLKDGFSTNVILLPDRTCMIRWIDPAGEDTKFRHPPRDGQWWIEDGVLFVDASLQPTWRDQRWWADLMNGKKGAKFSAWRFAIQDEALILLPPNPAMVLRRQ